ncbi:MAG: aminotransferase class V-fold PLP-dependent enzyme [Desulfovibrionales bacterium]
MHPLPQEPRELFPITRSQVFLNHAATSPASIPLTQAIAAFYGDRLQHAGMNYRTWMQGVEETRTLAARLIGADPDEVAFTPNTSQGLGFVAGGIQWTQGDEILVLRPDFPSNIYPWMHCERQGARVVFLQRRQGRISPDDVAARCTARTRLLTLSWVDYQTGFAADLEGLGRLCRERGILFCVDAVQGLGVLDMDVNRFQIDFLAAGGHKWLLGPMGIGLFFVSHRARHAIEPALVGWRSVVNEEDFSLHFCLKEDARRFEPGTLNLSGIFGLRASMDLLLDTGIENVRSRIFALNDILHKELKGRGLQVVSPMDSTQRSGILSFLPPVDPDHCFRALMRRNIVLSLRGGAIRLSPHFYNNGVDVERFLQALDSLPPSFP